MPNDTTGNPWKLDTAAVITTKPVTIKAMEWRPTTSGDDISVTSNDGSEIWAFKALAADTNEGIDYKWPGQDMTFNGLNLVTIDNGTLRVYVG